MIEQPDRNDPLQRLIANALVPDDLRAADDEGIEALLDRAQSDPMTDEHVSRILSKAQELVADPRISAGADRIAMSQISPRSAGTEAGERTKSNSNSPTEDIKMDAYPRTQKRRQNGRRHAAVAVVIVAGISLLVVGGLFFSGTDTDSSVAETDRERTPLAPIGDRGPRVIVHDCGVVNPGYAEWVEIPIRNTATISWSVQHIIKSCSCTNASISKPEINPGEEAIFKALFTAGSEAVDVVRGIRLQFQGNHRDDLLIQLKANVRPELLCYPRTIQLSFSGSTSTAAQTLYFANYSKAEWTGIDVEALNGKAQVATPMQLSTSNSTVRQTTLKPPPRQLWSVEITPTPASSSGRLTFDQIRVTAIGAQIPPVTVPVTIDGTGIRYFLPRRLFLGECRPRVRRRCDVTINFRDACPESETMDVRLTSDFNLTISGEMQYLTDHARRLQLEFVVPDNEMILNTTIHCNIDSSTIHTSLSLPLTLRIVKGLAER